MPIRLRGLAYDLKKQFPAAIEAYTEALELSRAIAPESEDVAIALSDLGSIKRAQGDYEGAGRDYREALRIAKAAKYREGITIYIGNLASLALDREEWPSAETYAHEALALAEELGRKDLIGSNCSRVAIALARQEKPQEGLPYARRAVNVFSGLRQQNRLAEAQSALKLCGG
jgi:tetratricopeptide (TPR) repeat protein